MTPIKTLIPKPSDEMMVNPEAAFATNGSVRFVHPEGDTFLWSDHIDSPETLAGLLLRWLELHIKASEV